MNSVYSSGIMVLELNNFASGLYREMALELLQDEFIMLYIYFIFFGAKITSVSHAIRNHCSWIHDICAALPVF